MNDLVSIITPAYNAEKYIEETINSVINQKYKNWEMIIVDDCSGDSTSSIVESYLKKDNRVRLIKLPKNSGVSVARNTAIQEARGRYIAFLDSDDLWKSKKLETQIKFMKDNNYYFTHSAYELINDNGEQTNKIIYVPEKVDYNRLLKGNPIGCLTVIIDMQNIKNVEMPSISHEDFAAWLNITKEGVVAYGINENLALHRRTENSLSSNKFRAVKWTWNVYRDNQQLGLFKSMKSMFMYMLNVMLKYK